MIEYVKQDIYNHEEVKRVAYVLRQLLVGLGCVNMAPPSSQDHIITSYLISIQFHWSSE